MNLKKAIHFYNAYINKYAQTPLAEQTTQAQSGFSPRYTHAITTTPASMNMTITELNGARSQMKPNESVAIGCANKIANYLQWFKTIGSGGNISMQGKDELIPTLNEMKALIKTGLFGEDFVLSLAAILKMNDYVPQFKNEFALLKNSQ